MLGAGYILVTSRAEEYHTYYLASYVLVLDLFWTLVQRDVLYLTKVRHIDAEDQSAKEIGERPARQPVREAAGDVDSSVAIRQGHPEQPASTRKNKLKHQKRSNNVRLDYRVSSNSTKRRDHERYDGAWRLGEYWATIGVGKTPPPPKDPRLASK